MFNNEESFYIEKKRGEYEWETIQEKTHRL